MYLPLIDSHIHLDSEQYSCLGDVAKVIELSQNQGVKAFVSIGSSEDLISAKNAIEISKIFKDVFASVGVHPLSADFSYNSTNHDKLLGYATESKVVAIGETGLDYFKLYATEENQKRWFTANIEIAKEVKKPLIIHCRSAKDDCYELLKKHRADLVGGVFHCYVEDYQFFEKIRDLNFLVSFPGILTFKKKSEQMREIARKIPLESMMIETDGPFLAPEPYRGKVSQSWMMIEIVKVLALLKDRDPKDVANTIFKNTVRFFNLERFCLDL